MKPIITLLGYTGSNHSHYWPQLRFFDVFKHAGYDVEWVNMNEVRQTNRPRIYITWNQPACDIVVARGLYNHKRGDVIIQKLTSLGAGDDHVNWGNDAMGFFQKWSWNTYKRVEYFYDMGVNIHAFGCKTVSEPFPEKHRIVSKLGDRVHWFNWGPCLYDYNELQNMKPIITDFKYDIGYVGMKWGSVGRGNIDSWETYIDPLVKEFSNNALAGAGNPMGQVSNEVHKEILTQSRLCPIMHCPSWIAEQGCQDRTYTVFASGRFGVIDNPGIYEFFDEKEVVCETDPGEYFEKSKYFANNIDAQIPYIETFQKRIKEELNFYVTWPRIIEKVWKEN